MDLALDEKRQLLFDFDIRELRVLGRDLGIKTPTSLTKNDLINEILTIVYSGDFKKDFKKNTRKFRIEKGSVVEEFATDVQRAKVVSYGFNAKLKKQTKPIEKIETPKIDLSKYEGTVVDYYSKSIDTKIYSSTNLSTTISVYDVQGEKRNDSGSYTSYNGFVDIIGKNYVIKYDSSRFVVLQDEIMLKYGLKRYDNLQFKAFYSPYKNETYLVELEKINGENPEGLNRRLFEELSVVQPTDDILINDKTISELIASDAGITKGSRVLFVSDDIAKKEKVRNGIVYELLKSEIPVFSMFLSKEKECFELLERTMPNALMTSISESPENVIEKLLTTMYRALRYVELGKDAVVVIDDYNEVYAVLESIISNQSANYVATMVSKFFNIGGVYSNNGSLTIIGLISNKDIRLVEKLKKCAKIVVTIDNKSEDVITYLGNQTIESGALKVLKDASKLIANKPTTPKGGGLNDLSETSKNILQKIYSLYD